MIQANLGHPLNRGRIAWWMGLPGRLGGNIVVDLMGRYPAQAQSAAKWANARPHAGPVIDAAGGYRAAAASLGDFTACTYGVRFTPDSTFVAGSNQMLFARQIDDASFHWNMTIVYQGSNSIATDSAGAFAYNAAWTPTAGREAMLVWTATGSRNGFSFYLDGEAQGVTELAWYAGPNDTGACPFWIGDHASDSRQATGRFAEAFVWDRVLSASEISDLYAESRANYPNLLARKAAATPVLRAAIPPASFKPWFSRQQPAIGTGIY